MKLLATEPLVQRLCRALSPQGQMLADHWGGRQSQAPGTVLALEEGVGAVVATGGCPVLVRQVQLEGKLPVEGTALLQQMALQPGEPFSN
jgi:methionyl-tRNA formyltransferase